MSDPDEPVRGGTGGGRISMRDGRVTSAISWGLGLFGLALLAIGGWVGTTLMGLRDSVTTIVAQNAAMIAQLNKNDVRDDVQDSRINQLERDVSTLNGKNLRGGPSAR